MIHNNLAKLRLFNVSLHRGQTCISGSRRLAISLPLAKVLRNVQTILAGRHKYGESVGLLRPQSLLTALQVGEIQGGAEPHQADFRGLIRSFIPAFVMAAQIRCWLLLLALQLERGANQRSHLRQISMMSMSLIGMVLTDFIVPPPSEAASPAKK